MLLQTNSYVVPKEKKAEHVRMMRRFRQTLLRLGCEHFEVYEQVGANWSADDSVQRFVQILRFVDRRHQLSVQSAERADPTAQAVIAEFCELINFPIQQEKGFFAVGYYTSVLPVSPRRDSRGEVVSTVDQEAVNEDPAGEHPADENLAAETPASDEAAVEHLTTDEAIADPFAEAEHQAEPTAATNVTEPSHPTGAAIAGAAAAAVGIGAAMLESKHGDTESEILGHGPAVHGENLFAESGTIETGPVVDHPETEIADAEHSEFETSSAETVSADAAVPDLEDDADLLGELAPDAAGGEDSLHSEMPKLDEPAIDHPFDENPGEESAKAGHLKTDDFGDVLGAIDEKTTTPESAMFESEPASPAPLESTEFEAVEPEAETEMECPEEISDEQLVAMGIDPVELRTAAGIAPTPQPGAPAIDASADMETELFDTPLGDLSDEHFKPDSDPTAPIATVSADELSPIDDEGTVTDHEPAIAAMTQPVSEVVGEVVDESVVEGHPPVEHIDWAEAVIETPDEMKFESVVEEGEIEPVAQAPGEVPTDENTAELLLDEDAIWEDAEPNGFTPELNTTAHAPVPPPPLPTDAESEEFAKFLASQRESEAPLGDDFDISSLADPSAETMAGEGTESDGVLEGERTADEFAGSWKPDAAHGNGHAESSAVQPTEGGRHEPVERPHNW